MIQKEVLIGLLGQKLSAEKIAKKLGTSRNTVLYWERIHGLIPAFPALGKIRRTRSPQEMAAAMIQKPIIHRRRLKAKAIAYKGGKCVFCGYDKCNAALEFHHLEKATKTFGLSRKGVIRSWMSMRAELDKCILVCANCHRELEAGVRSLGPNYYLGPH